MLLTARHTAFKGLVGLGELYDGVQGHAAVDVSVCGQVNEALDGEVACFGDAFRSLALDLGCCAAVDLADGAAEDGVTSTLVPG